MINDPFFASLVSMLRQHASTSAKSGLLHLPKPSETRSTWTYGVHLLPLLLVGESTISLSLMIFLHYTTLELLKSKDQMLQAYKSFSAWADTQHSTHIKRLRSNHSGEYTSGTFTQFLQEQGTECCLMMHDTLEHNGVAESLNHWLLKRVCAILHHSKLPKSLW